MRWLDRIAALVFFLLGCVHNFIAAPAIYESLSTQTLWFVAGGLALWLAAFVNFMWIETAPPRRLFAAMASLANATLLAFEAAVMTVEDSWGDAQNILLVAPTAWLFLRSAAAALARSERSR